jgi:hypothetical protein
MRIKTIGGWWVWVGPLPPTFGWGYYAYEYDASVLV